MLSIDYPITTPLLDEFSQLASHYSCCLGEYEEVMVRKLGSENSIWFGKSSWLMYLQGLIGLLSEVSSQENLSITIWNHGEVGRANQEGLARLLFLKKLFNGTRLLSMDLETGKALWIAT